MTDIAASDKTVFSQDRLSGSSRTSAIDRWIYVFTAASLVAVVLAGFIPDSLAKLAAIGAGKRPPFPLILHVHAVLMGSFLLLLLGQTVLVASGKRAWHKRLGLAAAVLVPAIVISGFILAPTMYHGAWMAAQAAPALARQRLQGALHVADDILLLQLRAGLLFPTFMWIALRARARDRGLHKRMIILATTAVMSAAIVRVSWLPTTFPSSALTLDLFALLAISPMAVWDVIRNRSIHRAYGIWAALFLPVTAVVYSIWDRPWWHATAHAIMGV